MFESRHQPLLPAEVFIRRMVAHALVALAILAVGLGSGVLGYHYTERLSWLDSLLNASMILGGMGPVNEVRTPAGKVFASCYALFSGLLFLVLVGVLLAPIVHRLLHWFHLEKPEAES